MLLRARTRVYRRVYLFSCIKNYIWLKYNFTEPLNLFTVFLHIAPLHEFNPIIFAFSIGVKSAVKSPMCYQQ